MTPELSVVGIDLAQSLVHLVGMDERGKSIALHFSHFVVQKTWRRHGVSPHGLRAHREPRSEPFRGRLVLVDIRCNLRQTARNCATVNKHEGGHHERHFATCSYGNHAARERRVHTDSTVTGCEWCNWL